MKTKFNDFINESNEYPKLCDLDIKSVMDNLDVDKFGDFQQHLDSGGVDINLSKSLCLGDEIIGGYLLGKYPILDTIDVIIDNVKNSDEYKNPNFFVTENYLDKYKNKIGIFSDFIYIKEEYRNNNYAQILIDYSKSLGDYVWGISIPGRGLDFWTKKQDRIKILGYEDEIGKCLLSSTEIINK